jgi:hypothetical protein
MNPKSIALHIEQLVLHGVAFGDQQQIGAAVERELTRLFAERGVPPAIAGGAEMRNVTGGSFIATPSASPDAIGSRVARAVYGGLVK